MLALSHGQVDLWFAFHDEASHEALLDRYREILTDEERVREKRFHFLKDQRQFLITRALVRTVLSRYSEVPPHDWRFSKGAHGRPAIANCSDSIAGLSFNLSHTRGLVMLGVARTPALGVDTENLARERTPLDIADRYFSPQEVAELRMLPQHAQQFRFFEYWTLKESYIKADGKGLSIPLDRFSFELAHEPAIRVAFDPSLHDAAERWRFWLLRPSDAHLAAVCLDRRMHDAASLRIRKVIPFVGDEPFDCPVIRQSSGSA
jgi:4'-phosphopantetheinyl transferase